jgi:hypothetical protein
MKFLSFLIILFPLIAQSYYPENVSPKLIVLIKSNKPRYTDEASKAFIQFMKVHNNSSSRITPILNLSLQTLNSFGEDIIIINELNDDVLNFLKNPQLSFLSIFVEPFLALSDNLEIPADLDGNYAFYHEISENYPSVILKPIINELESISLFSCFYRAFMVNFIKDLLLFKAW